MNRLAAGLSIAILALSATAQAMLVNPAVVPSFASAVCVSESHYAFIIDSDCGSENPCRNNPIDFTDPLGLGPWSDIVNDYVGGVEEFYSTRSGSALTQAGTAAIMTGVKFGAGILTAGDVLADQFGTFTGEAAGKEFNAAHIPIAGVVGENIGKSTATVVETPKDVLAWSGAVAAYASGVETALGGVATKRGFETSPEQPSSSTTKREGSASEREGQVASAYPKGRRVGGGAQGVRPTDPLAGFQEQGAFDLTPENIRLMEAGRPPVGRNGLPIELHHRGQSPQGPLDEMTSTTHDTVPHPISPSQIDRVRFAGERARYWRQRVRTLLGQQ